MIHIQIGDVEKILAAMKKFPEAKTFKLEETGSSGIGSIINLIVHTQVNGLDGTFTVEISGVENW